MNRYLTKHKSFIIAWALLCLLYALGKTGPSQTAPAQALRGILEGTGLVDADASSFLWIQPDQLTRKGPLSWHSAVFLARPAPGQPKDVFVADFQVTADQRIRNTGLITNLTLSGDGDENLLAGDRHGRIAFASRISGQYRTVTTADFSGEPPSLTSDWPTWLKITNRITNLQRTGRMRGVHWRYYTLKNAPRTVTLDFETSDLLIRPQETEPVRIHRDGTTESSSVYFQEMVKAQPAFLAWAVDTARTIPWIGKERIAWLERYWFDFNDWLARFKYSVAGDTNEPMTRHRLVSKTNGSAEGLPGWPPESIPPILDPPIDGEGEWYPVDDEQIASNRSGPHLFYTTFLRIDPERAFARVYMTAWDPNLVELGMVAGVREPISTTGVRGTGEIPRTGNGDPLPRLVGAFNGAFQSLHGEWGMVLNNTVLLPAKPFGATVANRGDGTVIMGAWPNNGNAGTEDIVDLRQNLLPLLEGDTINPYRLKWWGAAPQGYEERVFTLRTGLCLTHGGKIIYLWGKNLSPETLGEAMRTAGCDFGMHLDMNPGHSGFEYYRVDPQGRQPEMTRPLDTEFEAEGPVPGRPDLFFRTRKMHPEMRHMRFPRYIGRDPRDFFYLLKRDSIFDNPPSDAQPWSPISPQSGQPVAAVSTEWKGDVHLYKIDPKQTTIRIEWNKPDDALLSIPFSTSQNGLDTGLIVDGTVKMEPMAQAPTLMVSTDAAPSIDVYDKQRDHSLIQLVPKTSPSVRQITTAVSIDEQGYLVLGNSPIGPADRLHKAVETASRTPSLGFIPPGTEGEAVYWLVVKSNPHPLWERVFKDVKPVPPQIWREVYRQRGRLLDHGEEE